MTREEIRSNMMQEHKDQTFLEFQKGYTSQITNFRAQAEKLKKVADLTPEEIAMQIKEDVKAVSRSSGLI